MDVFLDDILDDDYIEDVEILDIVEYGFSRQIYDRANYFEDMDNLQFFRRFRLTKPTVLNILHQIEEALEFPNDINNSVSPINQLLTCLRFYACAGHLSSIADFMGMHTATASRIIYRVSEVIALLATRYINMPDVGERVEAQNNFFNIARFPQVIGCIDGTHVHIQSPGGDDPEVFRNRKGYFSINIQVVGDSNLKIRDIVARWPGSAHYATIFSNSRIRARFEGAQFPNCILLGDSGYALRSYFLSPVQIPNTQAERLYNESHIGTRNSIERLFGVWKRRFPILAYGIRLKKVEAIQIIIVATAVLHNIAVAMNEVEPPNPDDVLLDHLNYLIEVGQIPNIPDNTGNEEVLNTRNELINTILEICDIFNYSILKKFHLV